MGEVSERIAVVKSKKGILSLKVVCEDGVKRALHSLYDPEAEARSIVDSFEFDGKGIIVILGLGLGYHLAELIRRFPDADIVVVDNLPEICKIVKEQQPGLLSGVQVISGLPAVDVLKEVARHQTKKGIVPVSVFALPSVISAFPSYYRPILDSLNKTVSLKLWDRLRYSKLESDQLNVLILNTDYFLAKEISETFKTLGHNVLSMAVDKGVEGEKVIHELIEKILEFKPDFLLTINHLGFDEEGVLTSFLKSIEMPVASWFVDSPNLIVKAFDTNVSPFISLFIWDRSYMKDMQRMGFESVSHLPLGVDDNLFKPVTARKHRKKIERYKCDIGFVGNSMVEPVDEWISKVSSDLHPLIEKMAGRLASFRNSGEEAFDEISTEEKKTLGAMDGREKMDFDAAVIWRATLFYRLSCLQKLEGFNLNIHGDSGWNSIVDTKKIKILPPLNYYKELPFFYNSCKVNLNATSCQMREAVNQRVFDVPSCGAFLLTDYQESLDELFKIGEEVIVYKDKDEIPELVRFYLDNPEKRRAVANRAREKVLKEHTYKHRLSTLIESMKKKYG